LRVEVFDLLAQLVDSLTQRNSFPLLGVGFRVSR
jgi:hypothetical protein